MLINGSKKLQIQKKQIEQRLRNYPAKFKKQIYPIATVFFRFSHRDKNNDPLTNKDQKELVENLNV